MNAVARLSYTGTAALGLRAAVTWKRQMTSLRSLAWLGLLIWGCAAQAASLYLPVGDGRLRSDLTLLIDAGVLDLATTTWPLPRADVARALNAAHIVPGSPFEAVVERVRRVVTGPAPSRGVRLVAGHPGLLRDFATPGREDGNATLWATTGDTNWSATGVVTGVTDPADRHPLRLDGSEFTMHVGNWLLSTNLLDRWWGPGGQNSLILSNNARPVPAIMVDRAESVPFDSRWLHWIGPWRLTTFLGQMEGSRHDVPRPLFLGMRVEVRPRPWLELGVQRVNMFCGHGRVCGARTWWDMLVGKDNVGDNVTAQLQPGNALAGFDLRLTSPGRVPVTVYSQLIGEDVMNFIPFKYLGLFGLETGGVTKAGATWRGFVEYSDSTCSFYRDSYGASRPPLFGCAYNHSLYDVEGYRYLGRAVGAGTDNDSRLWATGLRYAPAQGGEWTAKFLNGALNRGSDPRNMLAPVVTQYRALEAGWRGSLGRAGDLGLQLGVQRSQPLAAGERTGAYGFLDWQRPL
jgi:hypothetical protein